MSLTPATDVEVKRRLAAALSLEEYWRLRCAELEARLATAPTPVLVVPVVGVPVVADPGPRPVVATASMPWSGRPRAGLTCWCGAPFEHDTPHLKARPRKPRGIPTSAIVH